MIEDSLRDHDRPIWLELEYADEFGHNAARASNTEIFTTTVTDQDDVLEFYLEKENRDCGYVPFSSVVDISHASGKAA